MMCGGASWAGDDFADDLVPDATVIILGNPFPFFENESIDFFTKWIDTHAHFVDDALRFCLRRNDLLADLTFIHAPFSRWCLQARRLISHPT
jgi:hypothetical protein